MSYSKQIRTRAKVGPWPYFCANRAAEHVQRHSGLLPLQADNIVHSWTSYYVPLQQSNFEVLIHTPNQQKRSSSSNARAYSCCVAVDVPYLCLLGTALSAAPVWGLLRIWVGDLVTTSPIFSQNLYQPPHLKNVFEESVWDGFESCRNQGECLLRINSVYVTLNSFLLWVFSHKDFLIQSF